MIKQILNGLENVLKTYTSSFKQIVQGTRINIPMSQYPLVFIEPLRLTVTGEAEGGTTGQRYRDFHLFVTLQVWNIYPKAEAWDSSSYSDVLNYCDEVTDALANDATLGGTCFYWRVDEIRFNRDYPLRGVEVILDIYAREAIT